VAGGGGRGERLCVSMYFVVCGFNFLSVRACVSSVCGPVCIFAFVYV